METTLTSNELLLIEKFVDSFVPSHRRDRWKAIIKGRRSNWKKLSIDDVWTLLDTESSITKLDFESTFTNSENCGQANSVILYLRGEVQSCTVCQIVDKYGRYDAILSIIPGELAVVFHHSEPELLCQKRAQVITMA